MLPSIRNMRQSFHENEILVSKYRWKSKTSKCDIVTDFFRLIVLCINYKRKRFLTLVRTMLPVLLVNEDSEIITRYFHLSNNI